MPYQKNIAPAYFFLYMSLSYFVFAKSVDSIEVHIITFSILFTFNKVVRKKEKKTP